VSFERIEQPIQGLFRAGRAALHSGPHAVRIGFGSLPFVQPLLYPPSAVGLVEVPPIDSNGRIDIAMPENLAERQVILRMVLKPRHRKNISKEMGINSAAGIFHGYRACHANKFVSTDGSASSRAKERTGIRVLSQKNRPMVVQIFFE